MSALAAEYYEKAIDIFTELGNANGLAKCYTNLATIYSIESKQTLPLNYFYKSLEIQPNRRDTVAIANVLSNLGAKYHRQKEYYKAIVRNIKTGTMINIVLVNRDGKIC